jgi:TolB protein
VKRWPLKFLIALGSLLFFAQAFAALEMELTQGVDKKSPIAIMQFSGAPEINTTIATDLQNSGLFELIPTTGNSFADWQSQKISNIVVGNVKSLVGKYQISFQLLDVYNRSQLLSKIFTANQGQFRVVAHRISDLVYQQLTGIPGIFSTKIVYVLIQRGAKAKYSLMVTDADGHNTNRLLLSDEPIMSPAWSPDGKSVAYVSFEGKRSAIYLQDVNTGKRSLLSASPGINGAPAWSHDGKKLALVLTKTDYPKIYVLDLATNKLNRITDGWSLDTEPNWAPDDQSLLFTSNRGGTPQLYRYYFANGRIERLTYQGGYNARGAFSPDGKKIIMLHREGDMFNIAVQDLAFGRVINLTNSGVDESPSIAPNGSMVVYATYYKGRRVLGEVTTDSRVKLILPSQEGDVQEPAWSPFL